MKRWFYSLLFPLALLAIWVLLNDNASWGNIALGTVLSVALVGAAATLRPLRASPKRPVVMARLLLRVINDIIHSNIAVAWLVWLGPDSHTPGFVKIPLDMRDAHGLAALACIITYTPGTVWCDYSDESRILTLHVLDLKDGPHWVRIIKQRYELPLMEIFE